MTESDLFGADFKEIDVRLVWEIRNIRNLEDDISRHCGGKSAYDALCFLDRACVLMAEARDRLQSACDCLEEGARRWETTGRRPWHASQKIGRAQGR